MKTKLEERTLFDIGDDAEALNAAEAYVLGRDGRWPSSDARYRALRRAVLVRFRRRRAVAARMRKAA